jgi:hypothetical protein
MDGVDAMAGVDDMMMMMMSLSHEGYRVSKSLEGTSAPWACQCQSQAHS